MTKRTEFSFLRLAATGLPLTVFLLLLAGFFGAWHPAFDSFAHFRMHLSAGMILLALPLLFLGYRKKAGLYIALGLGAFATTVNFPTTPIFRQVNAAGKSDPRTEATYRLLHVNARFDNPTPEKLLALIGSSHPDIIVLNEVSTRWVSQLDRISAAYPYAVFCGPRDPIGPAAILSRRPFAAGSEGTCFEGGMMATAKIDLGGRTVTIAALHLHWPWPFRQPGQIDRLTSPLSQLGESALAAGDLNASTWSSAVTRIADAGDLTRVSGSIPTWLTRRLPVSWRQWIGLPIDHVFAKGAITIHSVSIQEDVGSDHAPLLVEFSLIPEEDPTEAEGTTLVNPEWPEHLYQTEPLGLRLQQPRRVLPATRVKFFDPCLSPRSKNFQRTAA